MDLEGGLRLCPLPPPSTSIRSKTTTFSRLRTIRAAALLACIPPHGVEYPTTSRNSRVVGVPQSRATTTSLIKRKAGKHAHAEEDEDEEAEKSWTFIGNDEPDPDMTTKKLSEMGPLPGLPSVALYVTSCFDLSFMGEHASSPRCSFEGNTNDPTRAASESVLVMAGASSRRARGSSGATTEDINEDANKDAEDDTNEDTNEDANDDIPVAYAIQISPSPSCSHGQLTATFRLSASNRLGAFTVIYVSISATSTRSPLTMMMPTMVMRSTRGQQQAFRRRCRYQPPSQLHCHGHHQTAHPDGESEGGGSVWNRIAKDIFHAVDSQVPNWWDDHNSIATPSRTTMESLLEVHSLEDCMSLMFKSGDAHEDLNTFLLDASLDQDVLSALAGLFDSSPCSPRCPARFPQIYGRMTQRNRATCPESR
ncbi:glycosyltransferase family 28 domain-containing protein [Colletotrichum acutatum]